MSNVNERKCVLDKGAMLDATSTSALVPAGTTVETDGKEFTYVKTHAAALTAYQPYILDHNGTNVASAAPTTGAATVCVPQQAIASGSYGWVQTKGDATCKIGAETYVAGDYLQILNAGTTAVVDGTTGSTVELVTSAGVAKSGGTTAASIAVYLIGRKADVAGS